MASIAQTTCCGLKQIIGLERYDSPYSAVRFVVEEWKANWAGCFLMFPLTSRWNDNVSRKRILDLIKYIKKHKLGTITLSPAEYETIVIWEVDTPRLHGWAGKKLPTFPMPGKYFKIPVFGRSYISYARNVSKGKAYEIKSIDMKRREINYIDDMGSPNRISFGSVKVSARKPGSRKIV